MQVTLGGERLGSGKKNKVSMREYERSTHDLSYVWRSTMSAGTLVPFMTEVALPGDTFDINLDVDVLTHPTIGPLFGSYKIQLDVFQVPIRLYQAQLHMNALGIGMKMSDVLLPAIALRTKDLSIAVQQDVDNQQVNPSSILKYLGISGVGNITGGQNTTRQFNAIPYLAYWDIYKNYYSNKQEEIGAMIHRSPDPTITSVDYATTYNTAPNNETIEEVTAAIEIAFAGNSYLEVFLNDIDEANPPTLEALKFKIVDVGEVSLTEYFRIMERISDTSYRVRGWIHQEPTNTLNIEGLTYDNSIQPEATEPVVKTFPLENIDNMRAAILAQSHAARFVIDNTTASPYGDALDYYMSGATLIRGAAAYDQEGLGLKTYQSDLFNNWLDTEWIDGVDGISAVTAVDTSEGSFTIDELNLSKKIYDMLNRIAVSGGTYDDWLDAVYTHERQRSAENPMYLGGLIRNLVFQEVVSNAAAEEQPLGTLAGRGKLGGVRKGGQIVAKIDEPSYLIGIVSLTPHIDYSQGNKWDVNLKSINDLHKPALDEIGFQDLITEQMAYWDSEVNLAGEVTTKSAGKQPAWINYMTNVNKTYGNFAKQTDQMFMTLNRRYEVEQTGLTIKDLTTYIDPAKFNYIFADVSRDAQNFWTQIGVEIEARRKMSARVIPNL